MSAHETKSSTGDWHTPPEIIAAFPPFDLDPCASEQQTTCTAKTMIQWPTDGMAVPWAGSIWLNPPWGAGEIERFLIKMNEHHNGIALLPARIDVVWFQRLVWPFVNGLFVPKGRIRFISPGPARHKQNQGVSACPCVLVSYGATCLEWLATAKLDGMFTSIDRDRMRCTNGAQPDQMLPFSMEGKNDVHRNHGHRADSRFA